MICTIFVPHDAFAKSFTIKLSESMTLDSGDTKKPDDKKKDTKKDTKKTVNKKQVKKTTKDTKKTTKSKDITKPAIAKTGLLPLGDNKISTTPKIGYVYSCQSEFRGGGAFRAGEWISNSQWDPSKKPTVDGAISWPSSSISISLDDNTRTIKANNLPSHTTGKFPIASSDDAYNYDRNPNQIKEQKILLKLPGQPQIADSPSCVPMGMIGFMLSGVPIFNAFDAGGRDAPAYEIQDSCGGHPEMSGQYHYHDLSKCAKDTNLEKHSELLGYVIDGFGIYGKYGENGKQIQNNDLDACHGHTHKITWNDKQVSMYHYHFTSEFPYSIGCFKGTPIDMQSDDSDFRAPPFPSGMPPHPPSRLP